MVLSATRSIAPLRELSKERLWQCRGWSLSEHLSSLRYLSGSVSSELALWMKFNEEIASILARARDSEHQR